MRLPWRRQPPPGTPIDVNNQITKDLIFLTVGDTPHDLIYNLPPDLANDYDILAGEQGPAVDPNIVQWGEKHPGFARMSGSGNGMSGFLLARRDLDTGVEQSYLRIRYDNNVSHLRWVQVTNEITRIRWTDSGGNVNNKLNATNPWSGDLRSVHTTAFSISPAGVCSEYHDGVEVGAKETGVTGGFDVVSTRQEMGLGSGPVGAERFEGAIFLCALWLRELSADEHMSLKQNLWQIFAPTELPIIIPAGTAATAGDVIIDAIVLDGRVLSLELQGRQIALSLDGRQIAVELKATVNSDT